MAVSFNIQIPGESAVSVTLSTDAIDSITQSIKAYQVSGTIALGLAVLAGDATVTLVSTAGLLTGMGLQIDNEVLLATAISANVVTVTRGRLGTAAAAHLIAAPVTFVRFGSYGEFIAGLIADQVRPSMTVFPSTTIATANTAIVAQQAVIQAAVNGAVSHTP